MKKGLYEIFTALFFIVILLTAMFLWIMLSGNAQVMRGFVSEQRLATTIADEVYDTLLSCHGTQIYLEEKIQECADSEWDLAKGVVLEQPTVDGCEEKMWQTTGLDTQDTSYRQFSYWVPIKQSDAADVCIAQMVVFI